MAKNIKRAWFIDIISGDTKLGIVEKTSRTVGGVTDDWQAITEVLSVVYESIICDADLTSVTSEWTEINSRYHKTIVNKAIAIGYRDTRNKDLQSSEYFESLYDRETKKAKKYAKSGYVSTGRIVPQDF
jgi:hypothetical protein